MNVEEAYQLVHSRHRRAEGLRVRYRVGGAVGAVAEWIRGVVWAVEKWGREMEIRALRRETAALRDIHERVEVAISELGEGDD